MKESPLTARSRNVSAGRQAPARVRSPRNGGLVGVAHANLAKGSRRLRPVCSQSRREPLRAETGQRSARAVGRSENLRKKRRGAAACRFPQLRETRRREGSPPRPAAGCREIGDGEALEAVAATRQSARHSRRGGFGNPRAQPRPSSPWATCSPPCPAPRARPGLAEREAGGGRGRVGSPPSSSVRRNSKSLRAVGASP